MWSYIFSVIRYGLTGGEIPTAKEKINWENVYKICRFHKIEALVCYSFSKIPNYGDMPEDVCKKFQAAWQLSVARDTVQDASRVELLNKFDENGIVHLPLKGMLMKQFYPRPEIRMMADFDILFKKEQEEEVHTILTDLGYECISRGQSGKDNVYLRKPFMNIEMHYDLVEDWLEFGEYYKDPWKRAKQVPGKKYEYQFSWEDFYIFMIVHLARHFQHGGSGIRSIVDIWLFERKMYNQIDWKYVNRELEILHLKDFVKHMRNIAKIWFEEEKSIPLYDELTEFILNSGTFGTVAHGNALNVVNADERYIVGRIKVYLSAIFFPYRFMKLQYPYLEKYPFLLGVAWIQRIFRTVLHRKGRAKKVFENMTTNEVDAKRLKNLFSNIGLMDDK